MDKEQRPQTAKDDQDWFALLTGKAVPDAHPDTVREAQAIRQAVLAESATAPEATADEAGLQRLLGRLEQEGLLTPRRHVRGQSRSWAAIAAAALVVCALPWVLPELLPGPVPVEKRVQVPQVLHAPDPLAHARALQTALTTLGVTVQRVDQDDSQLLKAQLLQPPRDAVREVLQQYQLTVPADGKLIVEILPTGQRH
jgi:hypothetical protein